MPTPQLLSSGLELSLNKLLALDENSASRLAALNGKVLEVRLKELPWAITFIFNQQIHLLIDADSPADCQISLSLMQLSELQDSSQITQLIKQEKLALEGELEVAQQFAQLIKDWQVDWEQQLSEHTGDVFAHQLFSVAKGLKNKAQKDFSFLKQLLSEGATEEKAIAAHSVAMQQFSQQVDELRAATSRLEARISQKERQNQ